MLNDVVLHIQVCRIRENILSNNEAKITMVCADDFHVQAVVACILLVAGLDRDALAVDLITTDGDQYNDQGQHYKHDQAYPHQPFHPRLVHCGLLPDGLANRGVTDRPLVVQIQHNLASVEDRSGAMAIILLFNRRLTLTID